MTTAYVYDSAAFSDTQIAHKKGITLQQGRALREGMGGVAQGADSAPVVFAGWHPYNLTEVGGSETGVIYDFAVSGAQATVVSPTFEDGFEYAFLFDDVGESGGIGNTVNVEFYLETSAAYTSAISTSATAIASSTISGQIVVPLPRQSQNGHHAYSRGLYENSASSVAGLTLSAFAFNSTKQKISNVRLGLALGNYDAGVIYMLRRRDYHTG